MSPKKIAKRAKMKTPAAKRSMQNNILSLAEKVEKEFRQLPSRLAKLYRQELMAQKAQESKFKNELKKAQISQNAAQAKQENLLKLNPTKSNKKQLAAAKKSNEQANKNIKMLTAKLDQITKQANMLLAKQTKYLTLNKELAKLEKELTVKALTTLNKKPLKKTKSNMTKKAQPPMDESMTEDMPFTISSNNETAEM
ncbi:MAG TPA: hypothetical protein VLI69_07015 [Gammaproteobacteria bacterium]|nr:hypothetical protein [Gammaproteobacteria bacterium]